MARRGNSTRARSAVIKWRVSSKRLLLLIPTTTYRTEDFVDAARKLDVDLVIASDRPNVMSAEFPDHLLTLSFSEPEAAAKEIGRAVPRVHVVERRR